MMQTEKLWLNNAQFFEEIDRMLQSGHSVTMRAKGNSMFPFIRSERDSVVLQRKQEITVGSIVLARLQNGSYVLHRVYRLEKEAVVLMGDGNLYATERCRRSEVVGVVTQSYATGGRWTALPEENVSRRGGGGSCSRYAGYCCL